MSKIKPIKNGPPRLRRPNAARERTRVQSLRDAFQSLQSVLPAVPPSTKLSKLDILLMASAYIGHLKRLVDDDSNPGTSQPSSESLTVFHPVKKWPMRLRLYAGLSNFNSEPVLNFSCQQN